MRRFAGIPINNWINCISSLAIGTNTRGDNGNVDVMLTTSNEVELLK
jgi:hypothetical protein